MASISSEWLVLRPKDREEVARTPPAAAEARKIVYAMSFPDITAEGTLNGNPQVIIRCYGSSRDAVFRCFSAAAALLPAQQYDLLLRGGHVIDPAAGIDAVMDVAVSGTRIAAVKADISPSDARKVLDVSGLYVVPGLVDLHSHVFGSGESLPPDDTKLPTGTTTIVDAGGSGWRTFDEFRRTVMTHSKTRVFALINIVGAGMVGEPAESNTEDMDSEKTAAAIARNRDDRRDQDRALLEAWVDRDRSGRRGRQTGEGPCHGGRPDLDRLRPHHLGRTSLEHLRPGDIHTHMYNDRQNELVNRFTGKVQPYMLEARRRGVLLDLGHGAGSFLWPVATGAMSQGFSPIRSARTYTPTASFSSRPTCRTACPR